MHINELPDIVLTRIFYWTFNHNKWGQAGHCKLKRWRQIKLVSPSVCRKWRQLALSSAHEISFVSCEARINKNAEYANQSTHHTNRAINAQITVENYIVRSNLDIIGNMGGHQWPKTIQVYVGIYAEPVQCLRRVLDMLHTHCDILKNVRSLELLMAVNLLGGDQQDDSTIHEVELLGKQVCQYIPNVRFLEWQMCNNMPVELTFAKSLISSYSHQLRGFMYPHMALEGVKEFSNRLKQIYISDAIGATNYMPRICSESLTYLHMFYTEDNKFAWSSFESSNKSSVINFANLRSLRLKATHIPVFHYNEYNEYYDEDDSEDIEQKFNYKVMAPKLEMLSLKLSPFINLFLSSLHSSGPIRDVELYMHDACLRFKNLSIDSARNVFSKYATMYQDRNYRTRHQYMNDILNISDLAEHTIVEDYNESASFDVERMDWGYLKELQLHGSVSITGLKSLVSKLPMLEKMRIHNLRLRMNSTIFDEILAKKPDIAPISTSIRRAGFVINPVIANCATDLKVYLERLLPNAMVTIKVSKGSVMLDKLDI